MRSGMASWRAKKGARRDGAGGRARGSAILLAVLLLALSSAAWAEQRRPAEDINEEIDKVQVIVWPADGINYGRHAPSLTVFFDEMIIGDASEVVGIELSPSQLGSSYTLTEGDFEALSRCTSLEWLDLREVALPEDGLPDGVFWNCQELSLLMLPGATPPAVTPATFEGHPQLAVLVPEPEVAIAESESQWKSFTEALASAVEHSDVFLFGSHSEDSTMYEYHAYMLKGGAEGFVPGRVKTLPWPSIRPLQHEGQPAEYQMHFERWLDGSKKWIRCAEGPLAFNPFTVQDAGRYRLLAQTNSLLDPVAFRPFDIYEAQIRIHIDLMYEDENTRYRFYSRNTGETLLGIEADWLRPGHTFDGLYEDQGYEMRFDQNTQLEPGHDGLTLYVKWVQENEEIVTINITIDLMYGEGGERYLDYELPEGGTLSGIEAGWQRTGYKFAGLYKDETCQIPFDLDTAITNNHSDMTLYVKWTEDKTPEPTEPTQPTGPTTPTNPVKPTDPTTPSEPADPTPSAPVTATPQNDGTVSATVPLQDAAGNKATATAIPETTENAAALEQLEKMGLTAEVVGGQLVVSGTATDIGIVELTVEVEASDGGKETVTVQVTVAPVQHASAPDVDAKPTSWTGTVTDEGFTLYIPFIATGPVSDLSISASNATLAPVTIVTSREATDRAATGGRGAGERWIKVTGTAADLSEARIIGVSYRLGIHRYTQALNVKPSDTGVTDKTTDQSVDTNGGGSGCNTGVGLSALILLALSALPLSAGRRRR